MPFILQERLQKIIHLLQLMPDSTVIDMPPAFSKFPNMTTQNVGTKAKFWFLQVFRN